MCYTEAQIIGAIALAVISGSDWERMFRKHAQQKLGLSESGEKEEG